jgi:hypothetical protein
MASTLKQDILITPQDLLTATSVQNTDLGAKATTGDRRYFRYAKIGAVATVPGKVYQGPTEDTTNNNPSGGLTPAETAIGATSVTITSSTTHTVNDLAGGFMSVNVTPGQGYYYKIKGNTAVTGAANMVVYLEDPIIIALTTSSMVTFQKNLYNGIIVAPATMTNAIVGVPTNIFTAAYYAWIQTGGQCSVLETGTGTCGTALGVLQGGTIGSLAPAIAGTPIIGFAQGTNITGEYGHVFLTLD